MSFHVLNGLSILGHSPGLNPHGHLDINLELLNLSDLSVGLFNHSWVFSGLHLSVQVLQKSLEMFEDLR